MHRPLPGGYLGTLLVILSNLLALSGALGVFLSALGTLLGALGELLGALGTLLGCSWTLLGRSWALLGRSWVLLGSFWTLRGPQKSILHEFCSIFLRFSIDFPVIYWHNRRSKYTLCANLLAARRDARSVVNIICFIFNYY